MSAHPYQERGAHLEICNFCRGVHSDRLKESQEFSSVRYSLKTMHCTALKRKLSIKDLVTFTKETLNFTDIEL